MDERQYFDYELAYQGYKRALELFNQGGVETLINDDEFEISGGGTIADWSSSGYVPLYACGYNITLYLIDRNFDTGKNNDWYISGELNIYSYGGYDDSLYINDKETIEDRIAQLDTWAKDHRYSDEDYRLEKAGLEKVRDALNE